MRPGALRKQPASTGPFLFWISVVKDQMVTKWGKAVLAIAAAMGIGIEPEHIGLIAAGAAGMYGIITAVEAWIKQRKA